MKTLLIAYQKVHKSIISCETLEQVETAKRLVCYFNRLFEVQQLTKTLELLLERKKFLIEMEIRPIIYFLIGPPGIGKSTYTRTMLLPNGEYIVVSTDNLIMEKAKPLNLSYNEAFNTFDFKEIEKEFFAKIKLAIVEREDIIVDRTNLTHKGRNRVLRLLPEDYIKIAVVFDFSDREKLDAQLKKRAIEENKYVSKRIVDDMIKSYVEPTLKEFDQIIKL